MNDTSGHSRLVVLHDQANPTKLAALLEPETVERHRNVLCDEYDYCLAEALRQSWPSWSCERCPMFAQVPASQAMRAAHEAVNRPEAQF